MIVCKHARSEDEICELCRHRYLTQPTQVPEAVAGRRKKPDPDAHLGASEERFEKFHNPGYHPVHDVGVETC